MHGYSSSFPGRGRSGRQEQSANSWRSRGSSLLDILSVQEIRSPPVTNATQRAGYVVCAAPPERIDALKEQLISLFTVQDENGCDMILPIEETGR